MYQRSLSDHGLSEIPEVFNREQLAILEQGFRKASRRSSWQVKRDLLLFLTNYHLALRPKEVIVLRFLDVDIEKGKLHVPPIGNKIRRGRPLTIPEPLLSELKKYIEMKRPRYVKESPYLFPSRQREHITRDIWSRIFRNMLKKLDLWKIPTRGMHGHFSPYTLRHTKATEVYEQTRDICLVMNMLGHKTLQCTQVYIHIAKLRSGYFEYMRKAMTPRNVEPCASSPGLKSVEILEFSQTPS